MKQQSRRGFCLAASAAGLVAGVGLAVDRASAASPGASSGGEGKKIIPGSPYATFSRAVRLDRIVFVAGVVGQKPGTRDLASLSFEPQCRQALENLKDSVEASGSSMDKVLKCTVFITDVNDFGTFNKLYSKHFPKDPPARSSVVVKALVVPGAKLEIDCVAYVD